MKTGFSAETQIELRAFAIDRIEKMATYSLMYAATEEGFFMQVWLLLELAGVDGDKVRTMAVRLFGNGMEHAGRALTKEIAEKVTTAAKELLA